MANYTSRWHGFQIRSTSKLNGEEVPDRYSLVKWESHSPMSVVDGITGDRKTVTESCFVVAFMEWDRDEEDFAFESVGTRYLKYHIPNLDEWLLAFMEMKRVEYREED